MSNAAYRDQIPQGEDNETDSKSLLQGKQPVRDRGGPSAFFKRTMSIHHSAKSHLPSPKGSLLVSRTRLTLRILSLILSFALVVTLGHAIGVYNSTKNDQVNDEPLWPSGLKMTPTILLLSAAAVGTALSATICIASFSAIVRHITNVGNMFTLVVSSICLILWIVVAIVYKVDDLKPEEHWDLLSFACSRRHALTDSPANLHSMCTQMRYAWWGALAIGLLEIGAVATLVLGYGILRKSKGVYARVEEDGLEKQRPGRKVSFQLSNLAKFRSGAEKSAPPPVKVNKGHEYWAVENVLKSRTLPGGTTQYLIHWKGLSEDSDSWEPEESLSPEWIEFFKQQRGGENEYWEVEEILDSRMRQPGTMEYLIRWQGYSPSHDCWVTENNLTKESVQHFKEGREGA
ncbi:hypothetical protein LTR84_012116 [Exophiala bonariae]|uniref:Chromo domain-containing protein n=1 Tax=Exophiala bonariae TaxID=1690606 RepID=A0AAV9NGA7_9EURO|nr:hypothetical protein LTR84_012116 [Exophiala bonariae]